jgi:hypothetical protein
MENDFINIGYVMLPAFILIVKYFILHFSFSFDI